MKKIEKNLDIIYEKHKNKIVVNIYSDISTTNGIYHLKDINNNDTLNFISKIISYLEFLIINFYNYIIHSFPNLLVKLYKIQYMILILTLLFTFVGTLENNSHLTTNLMISAYFPKTSKIIYFKSDNIKKIQNKIQKEKKSKKQKKLEEINEKTFNEKIRHMNDDIKNYIQTNGKTKSTNINYEKKESLETVGNNTSEGEIYLFFIIPIKSFTFSIISISSLILFIKTEFFSKLSHLFIFNLACIFAVDNAIKYFYDNSYFFASSFMLILLLYLFKNLIDSIYLLLKFRREDFEIFSSDLMAINQRQFILKFTILNILLIIATYFSFVLYNLAVNYLIFYLCLLTLISFICNCLETFSPDELKPLKNLLMFLSGLINLTLSKLLNSSYFSNAIFIINSGEEDKESGNDDLNNVSIVFISELFSFFCFDYLREFIDQHTKAFYFHKKIMKLDYIMVFFLFSSITMCFYSIVGDEINCFLLSIFCCKLLMHYFIDIFKIKYIRLLNNVISTLFIYTHLYFSTNIDEIFSKFVPFNKLKIKFFQKLFDLLIILMVTYYEFGVYFYLYFSEKSLNEDELKELPEAQVNKILEFTSDNSFKNLKIQIIHENYNKFKMENVITSLCDIIINYFNLCIISFSFRKYEPTIFINIIYFFLTILFLTSKYFILSNIRNAKEYCYLFFISFYLSLRLITIPFSSSILLYISFEISALVLIINYSINTNRNIIMDIVIIIYLLCNYTKINKFFVILDIICLFISPKIKEYLVKVKNKYFGKNSKLNSAEENEFKNKLTIISFFSVLFLLIFQIYVFRNLEKIVGILENISLKMEFDDEHNKYYETTLVYYIINKLNNFFKINFIK